MNAVKYKYTAKADTWFKADSEAKLIEYYYSDTDGNKYGLFHGTYVVADGNYDKFWYNQGFKVGDEVQMREVCAYDEFIIHTIYTDDNQLIIKKLLDN